MRLFVTILAITAFLTTCDSSTPREKYYWMMNKPVPESGVRIWIPEEGEHEKTCDKQKVGEALALAIVLNIIQDVKNDEIHYHLRSEDRGLVLDEYLWDEKSSTGERRLGRDEIIHYHGVYVDLETAKELIYAVNSQPHITKDAKSQKTEECVMKIEGWGGYKFGMSMSQAGDVQKDARWEEIEYQTGKEKCLVRDGKIDGEEAKILIRFVNGKLFRIQIKFERFDGGCNKKLIGTIVDGLANLYGLKCAKSEKGKITWRFPQGGSIEVLNFCRKDKTGMALVTYEQSETF
jgi:hypothetical protein